MDTTTKSGSDLGTRWKRRRLDRSRNRHPARTRRDAAITDSSTAGGRLERATVTALGRAPAGVTRLIGGPPATAPMQTTRSARTRVQAQAMLGRSLSVVSAGATHGPIRPTRRGGNVPDTTARPGWV
jgi:hypothetical protein